MGYSVLAKFTSRWSTGTIMFIEPSLYLSDLSIAHVCAKTHLKQNRKDCYEWLFKPSSTSPWLPSAVPPGGHFSQPGLFACLLQLNSKYSLFISCFLWRNILILDMESSPILVLIHISSFIDFIIPIVPSYLYYNVVPHSSPSCLHPIQLLGL